MIRSDWSITATWPMYSERGGQILSVGTDALASSIVLACRPRPESAPRTDRRDFLAALKSGLPSKLRELQQGSITPVDLPQAAIGPAARYSPPKLPPGGSASSTDFDEACQRTVRENGNTLGFDESGFDIA